MGEETTIGGGGNTWGWRGPPDEVFLPDVPPPRTFDEPIEDVRARVETVIGKAPVVARDLEQPHPVVAKLLRQDDERRAKAAGRSYVSSWEQVLYDTPIQQRRLRLLSSILMTAGRCGCRGELDVRPEQGHPQNDFSLVVGDQRVGLRVAAAPAVAQTDLDTWAGWALEQADKIDPELPRAFLRKPGER